MKTILLLIFGLSLQYSSQAYAATDELGSHGGQVIQKENSSFEVVTNEQKEVKVYTTTVKSTRPSSMILKLKTKESPWTKIHLKLDTTSPADPSRTVYTGIIPANIMVSGGIQFDIDFSKKKSH